MADIFSELASMPCSETIKPNSIPLGIPKNALLEVELNVVCSEFCEGLLKVSYELVSPFGLDHDVIHVGLNGLPDEVSKTLEHTTLIRSPSVLQTKRHCDVAEQSEGVMKDVTSWLESFIMI